MPGATWEIFSTTWRQSVNTHKKQNSETKKDFPATWAKKIPFPLNWTFVAYNLKQTHFGIGARVTQVTEPKSKTCLEKQGCRVVSLLIPSQKAGILIVQLNLLSYNWDH